MEEKVLIERNGSFKSIQFIARYEKIIIVLLPICIMVSLYLDSNEIWKNELAYFFLVCYVLFIIYSFVVAILNAIIGELSITVTNKRVYGKANFKKRVDLPLDSISAVANSMFNGIAVATSSGKISFVGITDRDLVYSHISNLLIERQNYRKSIEPLTNEFLKAEPSSADEIKKYKELLDIGAITQEEFEAKKKQLLGL